jgi:hypothetical protein
MMPVEVSHVFDVDDMCGGLITASAGNSLTACILTFLSSAKVSSSAVSGMMRAPPFAVADDIVGE